MKSLSLIVAFFLAGCVPGMTQESTKGGGFFHNEGHTNAWLEVKLVGTVCNRSAIGANVRLLAAIGGKTFWQMRSISSGGGAMVAHFGLGDTTNAEAMRIEWPSGTVQEFRNVAAKQILTITEPPRSLPSATNGVAQFVLNARSAFQYDAPASKAFAVLPPIATLTHTNLSGIGEIVVGTNAPGSDGQVSRSLRP